MNIFNLSIFATLLFASISSISPTPLLCYYCNDFFNSSVPCQNGRPTVTKCRKEVHVCFGGLTVYKSLTILFRGCADVAVPGWLECPNALTCSTCDEDHCNELVLTRPGDQQCVVCEGEEDCNMKEELTVCSGEVPLNHPQYCFNKYRLEPSPPAIVGKGCGFGQSSKSPTIYIPCLGQACNMVINRETYFMCYSFSGDRKDYYEDRIIAYCGSLKRIINSCFQLVKGTTLTQGCTTTNELPLGEMTQICNTEICNGMDRIIVNLCATSNPNKIQKCMNLHSLCYVPHRPNPLSVNVSSLFSELGGCVEPWHLKKEAQLAFSYLLSDNNTHFCSNHDSDSVPCNSLAVDYSKRISCYRCYNCEDVWTMDHRVKRLCPEGTRSCFATFDLHGRVRRGCVHGSDPSVNLCKAVPHTCVRCDTNYCNSFGTMKTNAMCYKTRPYNNKQHMMTLRLESCMGTSFTNYAPPCYVAESRDEPFIRAGCLNEMDIDLIKYERVVKGDMSVVRLDKTECFKCNSTDPNYCFKVRFLEPEPCKGMARYAIRGCYTILERDRIERGCLTELEVFKQKLCTMRNFEEYCKTCRFNGCNYKL